MIEINQSEFVFSGIVCQFDAVFPNPLFASIGLVHLAVIYTDRIKELWKSAELSTFPRGRRAKWGEAAKQVEK